MEESPQALVSLAGYIVECNASFSMICGLGSDGLVGRNLMTLVWSDSFSDPSPSAGTLKQLITSNENQVWKAPLKKPIRDFDDMYEYEIVTTWCTNLHKGKKLILAEIIRNESMQKISNEKEENNETSKGQPAGFPMKEEDFRNTYLSIAAKAMTAVHSFHPQRILIVDDSISSLKVMAKMIQRLGHEVYTAVNGQEAIEILVKQHFDLVLIDLNMPIMSGLEISKTFRELEAVVRNPNISYQKLVAMSMDLNKIDITSAGFDAFISKPLTESDIRQVLSMKIDYSEISSS